MEVDKSQKSVIKNLWIRVGKVGKSRHKKYVILKLIKMKKCGKLDKNSVNSEKNLVNSEKFR